MKKFIVRFKEPSIGHVSIECAYESLDDAWVQFIDKDQGLIAAFKTEDVESVVLSE